MNSVVHFELPVSNMSRAREFYSRVFGWHLNKFDDRNTMVTTTQTDARGIPQKPGAINGSLCLPQRPSTPSVVIDVPDLRAHIAKVIENGGKLVDEPKTIPGLGVYARFEDPEGNLVGLWQSL